MKPEDQIMSGRLPKGQSSVAATVPGSDLASAIDGRGYPDHPYFPQIKIASDTGSMLEVFRKHLKPVSGKAFQIQNCAPVRFRWRRSGSRCLLQHAIELVDATNGRCSKLWVTSLLYSEPGRAERLCNELKAAQPLLNIPEAVL